MVSIAMMIGGAVVNALAFTGSNFLFSQLNNHSEEVRKERERHDRALEEFTKARDEWSKERVKYLDLMNERLRKEAHAVKTFHDVDEAMNEYYRATGSRFNIPEDLRDENEPVFSNFYTPSDSQKNRELVWIVVGTSIVGLVGYKLL